MIIFIVCPRTQDDRTPLLLHCCCQYAANDRVFGQYSVVVVVQQKLFWLIPSEQQQNTQQWQAQQLKRNQK